MYTVKPSKGRLLIAEPSILNDSSFNRAVILLSEHNDEGSIGFIMNRATSHVLNDIIPEIDSDLAIYDGGPVSKDNLYFIHNAPELIPNSSKIADEIYWGGDFETVTQLLKSNKLHKGNIRFFLGYSGWDKNQLLDEVKTTSWIVINNTFKNIFDILDQSIWKNELKKIGGEYLIWANAPKDPSLN